MSDSWKLWWNFCHSDHNWIQSFFMNNFYVHFQIVQIFCHIDHNWISFFMNSCNMFLQFNILFEIFAYSSQLYFSNSLWTFSICTLRNYYLIISFLQILHLNFVFLKMYIIQMMSLIGSYAWILVYFINIFYFQFISFDK